MKNIYLLLIVLSYLYPLYYIFIKYNYQPSISNILCDNNCRKISIALFQSGKVIIAGGCQDTKPIYSVYKLFNKVISEIVNEITKIDSTGVKKQVKKVKEIYISKSTINNMNLYENVLGLIK